MNSSSCTTNIVYFFSIHKKSQHKCFFFLILIIVGVTLCAFCVSAPEPSLQHYEREEPGHGGRREEEVCDEASSGGPSGNQENLLCQLHRHLQTVSPPLSPLVHTCALLTLLLSMLLTPKCYLQTDLLCTSSQVASSA